jgi:hypothetical protein
MSKFNDKCGIGDIEESLVEQGPQVEANNNRCYATLTNLVKK